MFTTNVSIVFFLLLLFFFTILIKGDVNYFKREYSLVKPYQGSGMTIPNWELYGLTLISTHFIRLTADQQSQKGGLYNKIPVTLKNWEVNLHFKISGRDKSLYGDGMAFWYVKDHLAIGDVFGAKDYFSGLGIFFDTYANQNGVHKHRHPYISAMVNNGSLHYDHDQDGTHTEVAGCEGKFRGVDEDTFVMIRYENDVLTVKTNFDGKGWKECLVSRGVILPTGYYFGVSAATGELSDNHDIVSIRVYELPSSEAMENIERNKLLPSALHSSPPRERTEDSPPSMSNLKFFFLVVCAIIGTVLLAAIGILFFQKHQETSRKRFY